MKDDTPGRRSELAGEHLEERTLAGAVGTDDAAQLTLLDGEINVLVGDETAERFGQAPRREHRPRERRFLAAARRADAGQWRWRGERWHLLGGSFAASLGNLFQQVA